MTTNRAIRFPVPQPPQDSTRRIISLLRRLRLPVRFMEAMPRSFPQELRIELLKFYYVALMLERLVMSHWSGRMQRFQYLGTDAMCRPPDYQLRITNTKRIGIDPTHPYSAPRLHPLSWEHGRGLRVPRHDHEQRRVEECPAKGCRTAAQEWFCALYTCCLSAPGQPPQLMDSTRETLMM